MKILFAALTILMSTQTFAAKCVIKGRVQNGSSCHEISTRMDVSDAEACEVFAKSAKENGFFNILEKNENLISSGYKFIDRQNNIKLNKTFKYESTDGCFD